MVTELKGSPRASIAPRPIPLYGDWKTTLRLHTGSAVQGLAVYFPADEAIPAKAVPASPQFAREFQRDVKLLQREQKPGVPGWLIALAYITVLVIGLTLYVLMGWGLRLLQSRVTESRERADQPATVAS